jgi:hypothetical protein
MKKQIAAFLAVGLLLGSGVAFAGDPHAVKVSVGYADTLRSPVFTPSPWLGSPGVSLFIGTAFSWDAGAIKLDNPSAQPLTVDSVTVDIGTATGINPWLGFLPIVIPGKGTAILTQTTFFNFDTSDVLAGSCTSPNSLVPVVHVTVGAGNPLTKDFVDEDQVLNTGGRDLSVCPPGTNEGHDWEAVHEGNAFGN